MTGLAVPVHRLVPAALTIALGAVIAVQSRVNGELATHAHTALFPAWFTMVTGLCVLSVIVAFHRGARTGLRQVREAVAARRLPYRTLIGGVFGGLFLVGQSVAVPLIGVAAFSVGVVAGQTSGSLVVDRMGISASGRRDITVRRVLASAIAVAAVIVGVSDRLGGADAAFRFAVLAFIAGAVIAPQQAVNGRVAVTARNPFVAAFVNFSGGVLMMSVVLGGALALTGVTVDDPLGAPPWAYLGGILGLSVIAGAAWVVPSLGVLVFSLLSVLGQVTGSLVLDLVAPTSGTRVGWHLLLAVAMTMVAVLVASAFPRRP